MIMKKICVITDKDILGTEGSSSAVPRLTARAIVKSEDGLYAVMCSEKFDLYSLPGGGIEDGEDSITALQREILEETGCECKEIKELGYIEENRAHADYTQISYYYVVSADRSGANPEMTDSEITNSTEVKWYDFETVCKLIADGEKQTNQQKFLQARDVAALREYVSYTEIN